MDNDLDFFLSIQLVGTNAKPRIKLLNALQRKNIASPEVVYAVGEGGLILRTRDGGTTWAHLPAIDAAFPPEYHAVDFFDADHGLVASSTGLIRTDDGGVQWRETMFPTSMYFGSVAYPARDAAYLAGSTGWPGIWKSADGGATWTRVFGESLRSYGAIMGLHFVHRDTGFALRGPIVAGSDYRLMATEDGGGTWRETRIGLPKATLYHDSVIVLRFADARTGYALGWHVGPTSREQFCFKTRDGGVAWESIPAPPGLYWNDLRFTHPDTGWSLGADGLAETVDGGASWTVRDFRHVRSMRAFRMGGFNASGFRTGFAGGTYAQILRTGEGMGWKELIPIVSPLDLNSVHFPGPDTGYAAGIAGQALRTTDGGRKWEGLSPESGRYQGYTGVHFRTARSGFLVGGDSGSMLRTEDGGITWSRPAKGNDARLHALWFVSDAIGIAVGQAGAVLRSVDGGATWVRTPSGTSRTLRAVHFPDARTGFAAGDSGTLIKTVDAGAHWVPVDAGMQVDFHAIRFLDAATGFVAGSGATLLKTLDGGVRWAPRAAAGAGKGSLYGIAFSGRLRGLVVGVDHLWETMDAGESWTRIDLPGSPTLRGATFAAGTAYVVGDDGRILASGAGAVSMVPFPSPDSRREPRRWRLYAPAVLGSDGNSRDLNGRLLHPANVLPAIKARRR